MALYGAFTPVLHTLSVSMTPTESIGFTSTLAANYLNGVDMNWLYLLLVLALMAYLMRALTRSHE